MSKVYICTGHRLLDQELQTHLQNYWPEIIHRDEIERLPAGVTLIWSHFLSGEQEEKALALLELLRDIGVRSLMICPYPDWIGKFDAKGFTGFIRVENGEIDVDEICEALGNEPKTEFRLVKRNREPETARFHAFWSAKPGMGVSTLAQAVAVELANRGRKTLLIEWDTFYPDAAFRLGLAGENHGLQKYAQDVTMNPSVLSYLLNKERWLTEYNAKEFRNLVKQLPDSLWLFAPTVVDMRNPVFLGAEQVQSVLQQVEGQFDNVVIDVPSELIHYSTVPSLKRADAVYILVDDKSTHLLLTMRAIETIKNIISGKVRYIVNRTQDQEILKEIRMSFGMEALFTIPWVEGLGKCSYETPFVTEEEYRKTVRAFVNYISGEAESVTVERKKSLIRKERKTEKKERPNRLLEFLSLRKQEV